MKDFWQLTFVTHRGDLSLENYLEFIELCIKGGVTCVQLREKNLPYPELLSFGRSLKEILEPFFIPLIINDNVELCLELGASGVHLGQSDGDLIKARQKLGSNKIIGLSVNTFAQVEISNTLPVDYIGVGAIFPTKNKLDVQTIWGEEGLKETALISSHPIIAIGGIDESNALSVINSGAKGIAAIGAFHDAVDPYRTTQNLIKIINEASNDRKN